MHNHLYKRDHAYENLVANIKNRPPYDDDDVYESLVANTKTRPPYDNGKDFAEPTTSDDLTERDDVGTTTSCDNGHVSFSQSTSAQPTTFTLKPQSAMQKLFGSIYAADSLLK